MDICDIGVYDKCCYTGKTCKADKRQCLSTYYLAPNRIHIMCIFMQIFLLNILFTLTCFYVRA